MNVTGKVISVEIDVEVSKKDGGVYQGSRLTYRTDDGKVQEQAFHVNTFKYNVPLKVAIANLSSGDNIIIEKEKKGDFWNVVSITKQAESSTTITSAKPTPTASVASKSTYATSEERAQTQVYIIRQSSVSSAVNLASTLKLKNEDEVIKIAKKFEQFVLGSSFPDDEDYLLNMENDIPL